MTLEARAMLSRRLGTTTLEVTTGQIDGAAGTGTIERMTVSLLDGTRTVWTDRINRVDASSVVRTYPGLSRGQVLTVEAQARAAGSKKPEKVMVQVTVLHRPDLSLAALTAPAQARPGLGVNIAATLRELGGDLGATTDCVLSVGGAVVDRADGVWVDGGDDVSCLFTYTFAQPGVYPLKVGLANTRPADDDTSNDERSATIEVLAPGETLPHYAVVTTQSIRVREAHRGYYDYASGEHADWDYQYSEDSWNDSVFMGFDLSGRQVTSPLARVTVSEGPEGGAASTTLQALEWAGEVYQDGIFDGHRYVMMDENTGVTFYMLSGVYFGQPLISGTYQRLASEVVYFTTGYLRYWYDWDPAGFYHTFPSANQRSGAHLITTTRHAISLTIQDGSTTWTANPVVDLVPWVIDQQTPMSCTQTVDPPTLTCNERSYLETGASGSMSAF